MSENLITTTPLKYLDKALNRLRDLGLMPESTDEAPMVALLNQITNLDEAKVVAIARTLNQPASSSLLIVGDSKPGVIFSASASLASGTLYSSSE